MSTPQKRTYQRTTDIQPEKKVRTERVAPKYTKLFINNEWVDSQSGETLDVINPATEERICQIARAYDADAEKAIKHARQAFDNGPWRTMSAHQRSKLLFKLADLIEIHADEIAELEAQDNGKTFASAKNIDVVLAVQCYRYYAGWCDKIQGQTIPIEGDYFCYTRREPVGVCAQIIPFNFPLLMQAWKWGPCLASGCVSILKTSEKTPLSALKIASLTVEAGFPPGVAQVLSGFGDVGKYLVQHSSVDKVAFTGSTQVGYWIQQNCSKQNLKRVTLELGGKSPNIICHDANLDVAVEQAKIGLFFNQGQCCIAGSRIYCHKDIYDQFLKRMVEEVRKIKVGDPFDATTDQGPQVDKIQFESVLGFIQSGKDEGAKVEIGGDRHGSKGYFVQPTIFSSVTDQMKICQEEIFGPVMQVLKFDNYEEVIQRANNSRYGLGAGVVTENIGLYQRIANSLRVGTVYVNCYDVIQCNTPFGGFKSSGLGRELGQNALENYLENKTIIVKREPGTLP